jgi:ABC-type uncharacterized transport system permease subunit
MSGHAIQTGLAAGLLAGCPLLFAALGELVYERIGIINIGIEGVMLVGAVCGYIAAVKTGVILVGLVVAALGAALFNLVALGIPVVLLRSSQLLVGLSVWLIGAGLSSELGRTYTATPLGAKLSPVKIPGLSQIPFVGPIFFSQIWPVYLGVVLAAVFAAVVAWTRWGLTLRAIGEDLSASDAAGVRLRAWQLGCIAVGGAIIGFGGGVLSIGIANTWQGQLTQGRGFLALALVVFARWRALYLIPATFLFGTLLALGDIGAAHGWSIAPQFLTMVPYAVTVAIPLLRLRKGRLLAGAPRALGAAFVRGQRTN